MSTAIVKHEEQPQIAVAKWYEPTDFQSGWKLAQVLANSGLVPKEFSGKPEAVFAAAAFGAEVGLSVMQSLRMVNVINGKPGLGADGMAAVCLAHRDVCEFLREVETNDDHSTWETKRVSSPMPQSYTFRMAEAVAAGWTTRNPNWKSQPQRMLRARAKSFLCRDVYPDLVGGIYDPQELKDAEAADREASQREVLERRLASQPVTVEVAPSSQAPVTPAAEAVTPTAPSPAEPVDPLIKGRALSAHSLDELKALEDGFLDARAKKGLTEKQMTLLGLIQNRMRELEPPIAIQGDLIPEFEDDGGAA